jgi:hypothetical protein
VARDHQAPTIDADVVELRAPGGSWRREPVAVAGRHGA